MAEVFVKELSVEERIAFTEALLYLTKVDGRVDNDERDFIKNIVEIYDLNDYRARIAVPNSAEQVLSKVKEVVRERRKALYLLRELLTLMNVDGEVNDAEIEFVLQVAQALEIEERKVMEINKLVLDYKVWLHLEQRVMEEM